MSNATDNELSPRERIVKAIRSIRIDWSYLKDGEASKIMKEKALISTYYIYKMVSKYKKKTFFSDSLSSVFQSTVANIIDILDIRSYVEKILDKKIAQNIKRGILNPIIVDKESENGGNNYSNNPFSYKGVLKERFKEDDYIKNNGHSRTLFGMKFIRAFYATERIEYENIIELLFFTDKNKKIDLDSYIEVPEYIAELASSTKDVKIFQDAFKLSDEETEILQLAYNLSYVTSYMRDIFNECTGSAYRYGMPKSIQIISTILNKNEKKVRWLLRDKGNLLEYGLVDKDLDLDEDVINAICNQNINAMFENISEKIKNEKIYKSSSFQVKENETDLIKKLLVSPSPVNILLYGPAGCGKTEYAKSIVKECGLDCIIYKNETEDDGASSNFGRLKSFLGIKNENSCIIVDEAENSLCYGTGGNGWFKDKKGFSNRLLDTVNNKVIWIVNYKSSVDESTLRRFTYSLEFTHYTSSYIEKITKERLDETTLSSDLKNKISSLACQYKITGSSLDNILKTIYALDENVSEEELIENIKMIFESNSLLLHGKNRKKIEKPKQSYDLNVLNTSESAKEIVDMVKVAAENIKKEDEDSGIRMLFYGLSGTGKTELAHYISSTLEKPLVIKRCSDILDPFVGMSERHISEAFEEAEKEDAVLLFDEVDSFISNRESKWKTWDRQLTNEFLTQMEEYKGILICTTNLKKILDPAIERRFHMLVEFKALKGEGIRRLLETYYPNIKFDKEQVEKLKEYKTVTPGDFGSLSSRMKFIQKSKWTQEYVINELIKIQEEKEQLGTSQKIGF